MEPGELADVLKANESHALIIGAPGTGKTTLIKEMISAKPSERVLVVDYLGNYRGYTRYYGPFPINPLEFIRPDDMIDVITQSIKATYADMDNPWTPAQQLIILNCFNERQPEGVRGKSSWYPAHSIPEIIRCVNEFEYTSPDDENARKAVLRRIKQFKKAWPTLNITKPLRNRNNINPKIPSHPNSLLEQATLNPHEVVSLINNNNSWLDYPTPCNNG